MRALRHIPPLLKVARHMADLSRPDAVLIQLTNPMNPICAAIERATGLTVYGVCHGVNDTEFWISECLGVPREQVRIEAAGNNHLIFVHRLWIGEQLYTQERFGDLMPKLADTPFRAEVFRRYGGLVGNFTRHPIEFLPGFLTAEYGFGTDWGVPALAQEIDPRNGERQDIAREHIVAQLTQCNPIPRRAWDDELFPLEASGYGAGHLQHEQTHGLIVALEHKEDYSMHLNLANQGALAGVSDTCNVELPVDIRRGVVQRRSVQFNPQITAELARVGREQDLIATAALTGERDLLVEALSLDALVPNRDLAARLVDEMCAFQHGYLSA